jgi:hypothetical protein
MSDPQYECPYCKATGIYKGTLEPPGVGVVCNACQGSGHVSFSYIKMPIFTERKRKEGVNWIYLEISRRRGEYIGKGVSVEDFYKGIMPAK